MKKRLISFLLAMTVVFFELYLAFPEAKAAGSPASDRANTLFSLGLFTGSGTNPDGSIILDLERTPTRAEAAVLLVRILGMEKDALSNNYPHPFSDVESWASPYIGFVYHYHLSSGTSDTTYGSGDKITAPQFITHVLQALDYQYGDYFQLDDACLFSDFIGLTDGTYNANSNFTRGDAAIVLYNALLHKLNGSSLTLLASLNAKSALKEGSLEATGLKSLLPSSAPVFPKKEVSYAICPAVPDFGAYFGLEPLRAFRDLRNLRDKNLSCRATFRYLYSEMDVNAVDKDAISDYIALLEKWLFGYWSTTTYLGNSEDHYEADGIHVILSKTAATLSNPESYCIEIQLNDDFPYISYPKTVTNYKDIGAVPDLGTYFGIKLMSLTKSTDADTKTSIYSYKYDWYELASKSAIYTEDYLHLLTAAGFSFGKTYGNCNKDGVYYIKDNIAVLVSFSVIYRSTSIDVIVAEPGTSIINCPIYTSSEIGCVYNKAVPDFGTYFGLTPFAGTIDADEYKYSFYFKYQEATAKYANIIPSYRDLLEKWGFSFKGTSTNDDGSVSDKYQKSTSNVTVTYPFNIYEQQTIRIEIRNVI